MDNADKFSVEPIEFALRISDFDLSLLPIDKSLLESDKELLRQAIVTFFTEYFARAGGHANIVSTQDIVKVTWSPSSLADKDALIEYTAHLLNHGAYSQVEPILTKMAERFPADFTIGFNMGVMLSNLGRVDEAIRTLEKAITLTPESRQGGTIADALVALGVAHDRKGDKAAAKKAFAAALQADPQNPHALMNMGAILAATSPQEGQVYLKKATEILPDNQLIAFNYAQCLIALRDAKQADDAMGRVIELAPYTELALKAGEARSKLANLMFKAQEKQAGGLRHDVVSCCVEALEAYAAMDEKKRKAVLYEVALLGNSGFSINDAVKHYALKSLPGKFSGVQLLAYLYVGVKGMDPLLDPGIDFANEYAEAKRMIQDRKNHRN